MYSVPSLSHVAVNAERGLKKSHSSAHVVVRACRLEVVVRDQLKLDEYGTSQQSKERFSAYYSSM